ncbi:12825_t:CDS:2 [Cetraspora pellucida]|uniref:12825_t:CDS:1 n=1 Tax=Cetraspora pellucida TaxID=1433469 RepID=A0A9N9JDY4_9GLOM|nr:12825_t:CDS:2 [Cetraspora pellucida]
MSESEFTNQDFEKCINSEENNKNSFIVASKENSQNDFTVISEENSQDGFTVTFEQNSQDGFTVDDVALAEAFANAQFLLDKTKSIKDNFMQLGVCLSHFAFDQNQLHSSGAKQSFIAVAVKSIHGKSMKIMFNLLVKTAIKIAKIDSNKLIEKYSKITSEKATIIGENMQKEILSLCSEIQLKRNQLENPGSYNEYFNILPNIIRNFFQALIIAIQQKKLSVTNK